MVGKTLVNDVLSKTGDVFKLTLNFELQTITLYRNDTLIGITHKNIDKEAVYIPAVTLCGICDLTCISWDFC